MKITIAKDKVNKVLASELAAKFNISKEVATLLLGRGLDEKTIRELTSNIQVLPKSNNITNVEESAYVMADFLQNDNGAIFIYADYDSDGVNAGFIMYDCLVKLKEALESECEVNVHFPNRTAGYGLNIDWCKEIVDYKKATKKNVLVITVDNGITKYKEVEYLLNNNIDDVIITDHHVPKKGEVPEDVLIVDPHLYPEKDSHSLGLCGAGVAFKIADFLLREIYQDSSNYSLIYLPHVAIATITDMMPLTTENIQYVKYGLYLIENNYCIKGISHYKAYEGKDKLTAKDIAFGLGPELNACGRMLRTEVAGSFFLAENEDEVEDIYCLINKINKERKAYQKELSEKMIENMIISKENKFAISVLDEVGGVGGVLAAKLVEQTGLPCMIVSGEGDLLHGSARGVNGLNLHALFSEQVRLGNLLDFGGHEGAAGVHINKKKINSFLASMDKMIEIKDIEIEEVQEIEVDDVITLKDINKNTVDSFDGIPFIDTLKEPLYVVKDLEVASWSTSKSNPENLCLTVTDGTTKTKKKIWVWGFTSKYLDMNAPKKIHLIGNVERDFMDKRNYTLSVKNVVPAC